MRVHLQVLAVIPGHPGRCMPQRSVSAGLMKQRQQGLTALQRLPRLGVAAASQQGAAGSHREVEGSSWREQAWRGGSKTHKGAQGW